MGRSRDVRLQCIHRRLCCTAPTCHALSAPTCMHSSSDVLLPLVQCAVLRLWCCRERNGALHPGRGGGGEGWGLCCPFCCTGTHFLLCAGRRAAPPALHCCSCSALLSVGWEHPLCFGGPRTAAPVGINPKRGRKSPLDWCPPPPPPPLALCAVPEQLWAPHTASPPHPPSQRGAQ